MANAAIAATAVSVSGGDTSDYGGSVGWSFTTTTDVTLTELGIFDIGGNSINGLTEIAVYEFETGDLIVSGVVDSAKAGLEDGFRYVEVADTNLQADVLYTIMAFTPDRDVSLIYKNTLSTAPEVNWNGSYCNATETGITMGQRCNSANGFFGPNFKFDIPAEVPVPAAAWLFGSGLIGLVGVKRRQRS